MIYLCILQDSQSFEDWKYSRQPTLIDVLKEFTSLKVSVSLLVTQLPLLLQRYYSISSSPKMSPGEIDLTIAVVKYQMDGKYTHRWKWQHPIVSRKYCQCEACMIISNAELQNTCSTGTVNLHTYISVWCSQRNLIVAVRTTGCSHWYIGKEE